MNHPTDRITHTMAFITPVVEHWLEREIAQWVHPMKDRSDDPLHHERTLLPRSYISWRGAGTRRHAFLPNSTPSTAKHSTINSDGSSCRKRTLVYLRSSTGLVPSVRSWCDGSLERSFMVDPFNYFSFQQQRPWYVLSCL